MKLGIPLIHYIVVAGIVLLLTPPRAANRIKPDIQVSQEIKQDIAYENTQDFLHSELLFR